MNKFTIIVSYREKVLGSVKTDEVIKYQIGLWVSVVMHILLQMQVEIFILVRYTLEPQPEGLPIDQRDDSECYQWKSDAIQEKLTVREFFSLSAERTHQESLIALIVVYAYGQIIFWNLKNESK